MREKGFTLTELMIAIVLLGILAAFAMPSISQYTDSRKIINAAEAIYGQLQFARSQAIKRSETVYAEFGYTSNLDDKTWLMGVSTNNNCDIDKKDSPGDLSDDCTLLVDDGVGAIDDDDLVYYVLNGSDFNGVELDSDGDSATNGSEPNQISFDPTRGTAGNRTLFLLIKRGDGGEYEMRVITSIVGRVRICTPSGFKQVPGYTVCT